MRENRFLGMAVLGGAAIAAVFDTVASAATATANLGVSATVTNNCAISTAALAFGSYDPVVAHASTDLDGTGTVIVACTKGATATIGLGLGSNASGSVRRMKDSGTNYITYELYKDASRSTVWGTSGGALLSPGAAPSSPDFDWARAPGTAAQTTAVARATFINSV